MKILIIGTTGNDDLKQVAKGLQSAEDGLTIAPVFITKLDMKGKDGNGIYYMSNEEAELSYKNNAFMWVRTLDNYSTGVTMPDMYNSSLFVMTYADFNNISNPVMKELDSDGLILVVIDKSRTKKSDEDIIESQSAFERIYEHHYLYFLDEKPHNITNMVLKYLVATPKERAEIEDALNS